MKWPVWRFFSDGSRSHFSKSFWSTRFFLLRCVSFFRPVLLWLLRWGVALLQDFLPPLISLGLLLIISSLLPAAKHFDSVHHHTNRFQSPRILVCFVSKITIFLFVFLSISLSLLFSLSFAFFSVFVSNFLSIYLFVSYTYLFLFILYADSVLYLFVFVSIFLSLASYLIVFSFHWKLPFSQLCQLSWKINRTNAYKRIFSILIFNFFVNFFHRSWEIIFKWKVEVATKKL